MGDRAMRLSGLTLLLVLLPLGLAWAESETERRAREDLERQLKSMVGTPPTRVRVLLVGLDQPNYELIDASFSLDGRSLPVPNLKTLDAEGDHLIFHGDVQPGEHRLESKLEYRNKTSQVVSAEGGFKWKPGSEVTFRAASGIEVQIKVTPELSFSGDIKNRITIKSPATVKMLAKLDDGSMPPPAERPVLVLAEADAGVADAGVMVVKGQSAAEKAAAAAEAKKKAREDALAAKQAAADEKTRKAEEAKAARLAAAEEKKAARLAAAEEKKRAAEDATAAKSGKVGTQQAAKGEPGAEAKPEPVAQIDAGPAVVVAEAEVDAGPAVVAAVPPTTPPVTAAPAEEESGLPMPVIIGLGVAVVGLVLFLLARRKKS